MSADLLLHDPICSELISTLPRFEEPGSAPSLRKLNGYLALVTVVSSAIYLYLNLFTLTGTPFLLDGDQVYFWTYAFRVLHGERIYQDVFTMHPPGASLFYAALFALFGARIWVTNFVVLALGVALCWLCFRIANTFMQGEAALSATAMFLVAVYGKLLNGTHHWFSVLAVLGAVALVLSGSEMRRIAGAGVLLGVASFFTQTRGPFALLGICIFLLWDGRRNREPWPQLLRTQVLIVLCFFGALFLLCLPYIATTGIAKLWYFQITYVRTHYVTGLDASMGLPELPSWRRLPFVAQYLLIYLLLPIVYALSLYRCLRERNRRTISRNWRPSSAAVVSWCLPSRGNSFQRELAAGLRCFYARYRASQLGSFGSWKASALCARAAVGRGRWPCGAANIREAHSSCTDDTTFRADSRKAASVREAGLARDAHQTRRSLLRGSVAEFLPSPALTQSRLPGSFGEKRLDEPPVRCVEDPTIRGFTNPLCSVGTSPRFSGLIERRRAISPWHIPRLPAQPLPSRAKLLRSR